MTLDLQFLRRLVVGGAVLGAGGGGTIEAGLASCHRALAQGRPRLLELADLSDDSLVVTFSCVGSVSEPASAIRVDELHQRAFALFRSFSRKPVAGIIASEVGPTAVTYGLAESARTGTPIIDAPCNGRAHPLGVMGSLNLHRAPSRKLEMTAVGGRAGSDPPLEMALRANVVNGARIVRSTAAHMGLPLAVVRNPVPAHWLRRHAAVGALRFAHEIGKSLMNHRRAGPAPALAALSTLLAGKVAATGIVSSSNLRDRGGFTVGAIEVTTREGANIRISVCNEFMMVTRNGVVESAFPDLICVFDQHTALPLASTAVKPGRTVAIFTARQDCLRLGSTMRDQTLLRPIEALLKIQFPTRPQRKRPAAPLPLAAVSTG